MNERRPGGRSPTFRYSQFGDVVRLIERRTLDVGLREIARGELETALARSEILHIRVVGLARLASDIPADLALDTIGSIHVLGAMQASPELLAALQDRIT